MNQKIQNLFIRDHENRFSSETIRSYRLSLAQFFTFCPKPFDEVRATHIRAWLVDMREKGLKPRSIHLKLSALKSFYRYCLEENRIKRNPTSTVPTPKKEDTLPYYLTKHQLALLQDHTKDDLRERAIIDTLYATGVRISELLNIKLADIKWERRQLWIRKGKGNKERFVLFTYECAERIKSYLDSRKIESDYLFCNQRGEPLSRVYVQHKFREYSESLGFKVVPHTMRHTFAAHLAEKNMKKSYIQELLGHSNINSTHIYTRLNAQARKRQYDQYQI